MRYIHIYWSHTSPKSDLDSNTQDQAMKALLIPVLVPSTIIK
jgi:hypothetical protein